MKCPNCKLESPPSALRCECGYDFPSSTLKEPYCSPESPNIKHDPSLDGVRGWLLLLCLGLCSAPFVGLFQIFNDPLIREPVPFTLEVMFGLACVVVMSIYSFVAGYKLWTVKPGAVGFARKFLIVRLVLACLSLLHSFVNHMRLRPQGPYSEVGAVIATLIWLSYLRRSKRVAITYRYNRVPQR
jgi:hypothetical protein